MHVGSIAIELLKHQRANKKKVLLFIGFPLSKIYAFVAHLKWNSTALLIPFIHNLRCDCEKLCFCLVFYFGTTLNFLVRAWHTLKLTGQECAWVWTFGWNVIITFRLCFSFSDRSTDTCRALSRHTRWNVEHRNFPNSSVSNLSSY